MPAGLEVRDGNNNVVVDTTTWLGRFIGKFTIPANAQTGSVAVDNRLVRGTPWHICIVTDDPPSQPVRYPKVWFALVGAQWYAYWDYGTSTTSHQVYTTVVRYGVY